MGVEQDSPAIRVSTPVDGIDVLGALSPSRAGDFMSCPLLYRFRTIDRLPEPFSPDAVRGTLIHKVLEDLFDLPAAERTPEQASEMLEPAWAALVEQEPVFRARLLEYLGRSRLTMPLATWLRNVYEAPASAISATTRAYSMRSWPR